MLQEKIIQTNKQKHSAIPYKKIGSIVFIFFLACIINIIIFSHQNTIHAQVLDYGTQTCTENCTNAYMLNNGNYLSCDPNPQYYDGAPSGGKNVSCIAGNPLNSCYNSGTVGHWGSQASACEFGGTLGRSSQYGVCYAGYDWLFYIAKVYYPSCAGGAGEEVDVGACSINASILFWDNSCSAPTISSTNAYDTTQGKSIGYGNLYDYVQSSATAGGHVANPDWVSTTQFNGLGDPYDYFSWKVEEWDANGNYQFLGSGSQGGTGYSVTTSSFQMLPIPGSSPYPGKLYTFRASFTVCTDNIPPGSGNTVCNSGSQYYYMTYPNLITGMTFHDNTTGNDIPNTGKGNLQDNVTASAQTQYATGYSWTYTETGANGQSSYNNSGSGQSANFNLDPLRPPSPQPGWWFTYTVTFTVSNVYSSQSLTEDIHMVYPTLISGMSLHDDTQNKYLNNNDSGNLQDSVTASVQTQYATTYAWHETETGDQGQTPYTHNGPGTSFNFSLDPLRPPTPQTGYVFTYVESFDVSNQWSSQSIAMTIYMTYPNLITGNNTFDVTQNNRVMQNGDNSGYIGDQIEAGLNLQYSTASWNLTVTGQNGETPAVTNGTTDPMFFNMDVLNKPPTTGETFTYSLTWTASNQWSSQTRTLTYYMIYPVLNAFSCNTPSSANDAILATDRAHKDIALLDNNPETNNDPNSVCQTGFFTSTTSNIINPIGANINNTYTSDPKDSIIYYPGTNNVALVSSTNSGRIWAVYWNFSNASNVLNQVNAASVRVALVAQNLADPTDLTYDDLNGVGKAPKYLWSAVEPNKIARIPWSSINSIVVNWVNNPSYSFTPIDGSQYTFQSIGGATSINGLAVFKGYIYADMVVNGQNMVKVYDCNYPGNTEIRTLATGYDGQSYTYDGNTLLDSAWMLDGMTETADGKYIFVSSNNGKEIWVIQGADAVNPSILGVAPIENIGNPSTLYTGIDGLQIDAYNQIYAGNYTGGLWSLNANTLINAATKNGNAIYGSKQWVDGQVYATTPNAESWDDIAPLVGSGAAHNPYQNYVNTTNAHTYAEGGYSLSTLYNNVSPLSQASITPTQPQAPTGPSQALPVQGLWYNNATLTAPVTSTTQDNYIHYVDGTAHYDCSGLSYNYAQSTFPSAVAGGSASAHWTGYIYAPTTGTYKIAVCSDDGVKFTFNGSLRVNTLGQNQAATLNVTTMSLTAGSNAAFDLQYADQGTPGTIDVFWERPGDSSYSLAPVFSSRFDPTFHTQYAVQGSFYNTTDLSGTVADTSQDDYITYNDGFTDTPDCTGTTNPGTRSIPAKANLGNVSAKWDGYIYAQTSGDYNFGICSDDGSQLSVNSQTLFNNFGVSQASKFVTGTVTLNAGQIYPFHMQWANLGGTGQVAFFWEKPGDTQYSLTPVYNANPITATPTPTLTQTATPTPTAAFAQYGILGNAATNSYPVNGKGSLENWEFLSYASGLLNRSSGNVSPQYGYANLHTQLCQSASNNCIENFAITNNTINASTTTIQGVTKNQIYVHQGNITIDADNGGINADGILFVNGDVTINADHQPNFYVNPTNRLLLIASGKVTINPTTYYQSCLGTGCGFTYQYVNMSIIADGAVTFADYPGNVLPNYTQPLIINGDITSYTSMTFNFDIGELSQWYSALGVNFTGADINRLSQFFTAATASEEIGL